MRDNPSEDTPNRREVRKARTAHTLIHLARCFTQNRGLSGFTLEELCEAADVSRRTFFNYFASKEDAVLGITKTSPLEPHRQEFVDSHTEEPLVHALFKLISDSIEDVTTSDFGPAQLMALVHHEPALINRVKRNAFASISEIERLICEREGLHYPSEFARSVGFVMHHLTLASLMPPPLDLSQPTPTEPAVRDKETFQANLRSHLDHLMQLLTPLQSQPIESVD